jgi:hypothetical protein
MSIGVPFVQFAGWWRLQSRSSDAEHRAGETWCTVIRALVFDVLVTVTVWARDRNPFGVHDSRGLAAGRRIRLVERQRKAWEVRRSARCHCGTGESQVAFDVVLDLMRVDGD